MGALGWCVTLHGMGKIQAVMSIWSRSKDKQCCPDCNTQLRANPDKMTCPNPFCPLPDFAYTGADFPK